MPKKNSEQVRLEKICKVLKDVKIDQWKHDEHDYNYYVIKNRLKFGLTGTFSEAGHEEFQVEDVSLYVMDESTGTVIERYGNVRQPYLCEVFETLSRQEAGMKEANIKKQARARLDDLLDKE